MALVSEYNATGQRMALRESDTLYGVSRFGSASYGEEVAIWSVPEIGGRDEVGRLLVVEDANSDTATMAYDIDGRCTQIGHNNGLSDLMSFDIVGKLLSKRVQGSETLMEMHYGYSLAGDRIAQQTDLDTFTYLADAAGRLVEESHNRFCIDHPNIWKQGQWEFLEFDEETRSLQLASLNDDFSGNALDLQRWTLEGRQNGRSDDVLGELDAVGLELRQNEGLQVAYPRAFSNQSVLHRAPVDNSIGVDAQNYPTPGNGYPEALGPKPLWLDMRHNQKLVGDFDIAIDYQNFLGGGGYEFDVQLAVSPTTLTPDFSETWLAVRLTAEGSSRYLWFTKTDSTITSPVPGINFTGYHYGPPAQGQMRLKRTGSTYQGFYRAQDASSWTSMSILSGPTDDLNLYLSFANYRHSACVRLTNFQFLSGNSRASEGIFVSGIYDAGRVVSWDSLRWTEDLPSGCDVELEVCVADDYAEFENFASPPAFFGPTGGGNFTTPAGQALPTGKTGRYAMVRATLTGNGTDTPTLSDIQLTCNANSDNGSRVLRTRYDNAGNITRMTTVDDSGVIHDVRDSESWAPEERINSLNQVMRQDTGHVNWRFIWDDNGNLTRKSCGAETFTYVWNVENRLLQVTKEVTVGGWGAARFHEGTFHQTPSTFTEWVVNYTYDSAGRMITRDDNNGNVTTFLWDGWQMIRETTGESVTTYCIPEGHLLSFIRDGARFDCHTDALASVRLVTDEEGAVVSRFDTGAYGELLAGSFDGVPGGMPYTWVGGLGVRADSLTGLFYMRHRWYDPTSQRFISRDPIGLSGGENLYSYARNSPADLVDPSGLIAWMAVLSAAATGGLTSVGVGAGIRYCQGKEVWTWDDATADFAGGAVFSGGFALGRNLYWASQAAKFGPEIAGANGAARRLAAQYGSTLPENVTIAKGLLTIGGRSGSFLATSGERIIPGLLPPSFESVFGAARNSANAGIYDAERTMMEQLFPHMPRFSPSTLRIIMTQGSCSTCRCAAQELMIRRPFAKIILIGPSKLGAGYETYVFGSMAEDAGIGVLSGAAGNSR